MATPDRISYSARPMTERERRLARNCISTSARIRVGRIVAERALAWCLGGLVLWLSLWFVVVLPVRTLTDSRNRPATVAVTTLLVFLACVGGAVRGVRSEIRTIRARNVSKAIREREAAAGAVAVARIRPLAVAEVLRDSLAHGFQGKVFVFRIDNRHAIVISDVGLTLLCDGEGKNFPNDDFEIVRLPESKIVIDISCYGGRMTPQKILPAKIEKGIYRDGEPFEIDWDAFLAGRVKI